MQSLRKLKKFQRVLLRNSFNKLSKMRLPMIDSSPNMSTLLTQPKSPNILRGTTLMPWAPKLLWKLRNNLKLPRLRLMPLPIPQSRHAMPRKESLLRLTMRLVAIRNNLSTPTLLNGVNALKLEINGTRSPVPLLSKLLLLPLLLSPDLNSETANTTAYPLF